MKINRSRSLVLPEPNFRARSGLKDFFTPFIGVKVFSIVYAEK